MDTTTGRTILGAASVLAAIGIVAIASAKAGTATTAAVTDGMGAFLRWEIVLVLIAFAAFLVLVDLDYRHLQTLAPAIYVVTMVLLVLVLVPGIGHEQNGQRRWFRQAGFSLQPSELAKLAVILSVARYASLRGAGLGDFKKGLLPGLALIALPAILIGLEVDLGTSLFVAATGLLVLVVAGGRLTHLLPLAGLGLPAVLWVGFNRLAHVRTRIEVFLHPEMDPTGKGHQILQSLIAVGNGGVAGLGLGAGRQKRFFLPENRTDFIFSSLAEEVGFVGCLLILALFVLLFIQGMRVAFRARDSFGALVAIGIASVIGIQAAANIAVVTSCVPTKGIALPFISRGGSSLVVMMAMVAILVSISNRSVDRSSQPDAEPAELDRKGLATR